MAALNLLYLLGKSEYSLWDNNEIRYSVRSMSTTNDVGWVGITGPEMPAFFKDVHHTKVEIQEKKKFANLLLQLLAAMADPAVPEQLILMNDDFFMRPTPVWDWTPTHMGPVKQKWHNGWSKSVSKTGELLAQHFEWCSAPLNYEGHTPMPIDKSRALETLKWLIPHATEQSLQFRTAYGNMWQIGGNWHVNAKHKKLSDWPADSPFLSLKASPETEIKDFITSTWPDKSRWEV